MKVRKAQNKQDIEKLKPVALQWKETCNGIGFGIELVPEKHFSDLADLIERDDADLFLLIDDEKVVGYLGVTIFSSPLGNQKIANEHFFYILPQYRGMSSVRMIKTAQKWAKDRNCSHLILNASRMASSLYERACGLYERLNFREFERSYILAL